MLSAATAPAAMGAVKKEGVVAEEMDRADVELSCEKETYEVLKWTMNSLRLVDNVTFQGLL